MKGSLPKQFMKEEVAQAVPQKGMPPAVKRGEGKRKARKGARSQGR